MDVEGQHVTGAICAQDHERLRTIVSEVPDLQPIIILKDGRLYKPET